MLNMVSLSGSFDRRLAHLCDPLFVLPPAPRVRLEKCDPNPSPALCVVSAVPSGLFLISMQTKRLADYIMRPKSTGLLQ